MSNPPTTAVGTLLTTRPLISRSGWLWIAALGGLFFLLHFDVFRRTYLIATGEWSGDWSHALAIPFLSLYFLYQNQERLQQVRPRAYWPGLGLLFLALLSCAFWTYPGRNDMFRGYSMILSLLGLVLFVLGKDMLRVLWFPVAYLALGIKVSDNWWDRLAAMLRLFAAKAATLVLNLVGVPLDLRAESQGATIDLWVGLKKLYPPMDVADACAGLRMLMAFVALGVAMAYLFPRPWWQRITMVVLAVPIAVAVNVGRVVVLALIRAKVNPEMAAGEFHIFIGMLMLLPAAGLFWLLGWVMDRIIIYDDKDGEPGAPRSAAPAPGAAAPADEPAYAETVPEGEPTGKLVARGAALGVGLTVLLGLNLALAVGVLRPDLWSRSASRVLALALFGVGLAALLGLLHYLYHYHIVGRGAGSGPRSQALALAMGAGILAAATLGQGAVVRAAGFIFVKAPLPLRDPLYHLPRTLGAWEAEGKDQELPEEQIGTLGTRKYVIRTYVDRAAAPGTPGSAVLLQVAYYTGTVDTVPHVPERCYTAGGKEALGGKAIMDLALDPRIGSKAPLGGRGVLDLGPGGPVYTQRDDGWFARTQRDPAVRIPSLRMSASAFSFYDRGQPNHQSTVLYFFAANGRFLATGNDVRLHGFDIRDRCAYYCKIELLFDGVGDKAVAAQRASAFLSAALPEVLACLPDWAEVTAGRWPPPTTGRKIAEDRGMEKP